MTLNEDRQLRTQYNKMSKIKGHPGLYRPNYRDKSGQMRESQNIWGSYWCRRCRKHPQGGPHKENLHTNLVKQAVVNLARLKSQPKRSMIDADEITVNSLLDAYLNRTSTHCKRSTYIEYEDVARVHIRPELGFYRATDLIYDNSILQAFVAGKQRAQVRKGKIGYSPSRINAMLNVLSGAFRNAHKELAGMRPEIVKLKDRNVRKVYFSDTEIEILLRRLPNEIVRPLLVLNITGWRSLSEVLSRKQNHVDWRKRVLILEPGEAKNSEPRIFPFNDELQMVLEDQRKATEALEQEKTTIIPWLFHDHDGNPLVTYHPNRDYWKPTRYFLNQWKAALKNAGLSGRRLHDFRRTVIRRFGDSGIDDAVGMLLSGHKSLRIYHDYKAVHEADLFAAVKKLSSPRKETKND